MTLRPPAREQMRNSTRVSLVYWLALAGIGIWSMLAASRLVPESPRIDTIPFLIVLALETANLAARSYDRLRRERSGQVDGYRHHPFSWSFVTIDLILVAAGLRFTGAFQSPLWVVIFLIGIAETLLAPAAEAYLIRYGAILSLLLGTLPTEASGYTLYYFLDMGIRIGSFLAVSSVARRLRLTHESEERENASLRAELALTQERSHLSREVHDGVGNSLAAAVLRLEFAAHRADKDGSAQTASLLREEADCLRTAMSAIRDWTFFTKPWSVGDNDSLSPAARLTTEVERLSRRTGMEMRVAGAEHLDMLSPPSRLAALRIVQEGLTNTVKHAKDAHHAEVRLTRERDSVILVIADDGSGFDLSGPSGTGVGMSSMRERAEGLGGSFTIDSKPGLGTTITATLPS